MFNKNIELVKAIEAMAEARHVTSPQLALAWIMSKGILPIPGTKRRKYVEQNIAATTIVLTQADLSQTKKRGPLRTPISLAIQLLSHE